MYSTSAEEIEENRLKGLNTLHNPKTMQYIEPYLPRKRILEIGCGMGLLAKEILTKSPGASFVGVDRDPAQIKWTQENLSPFPAVKVIQLDLLEINAMQALRQEGGFDLIYCRWVLVHIPQKKLIDLLKNIFDLLTPGGIFICDECDNRQVLFRSSTGKTPSSYCAQATKNWLDLSKALMKHFGNDIELTSDKISQLLKDTHCHGHIKIEGQYQVPLTSTLEKMHLINGYHSAAGAIKLASGKDVTKLIIPTAITCAEDPNVTIDFLQENVVSWTKF
jgi:SAM-dependent methyltransferase